MSYFPSKQQLATLIGTMTPATLKNAIKKGFIARTDSLPVDKTVQQLTRQMEQVTDEQERQHLHNLRSRLLSVSDVTPYVYNLFTENKNSMAYWFNALVSGVEKSETTLRIPSTQIHRLPIELAQFIRIEYTNTNPENRQQFNQYIMDTFALDATKTYFIKTGVFSSKFQFANAKCAEPLEMGEYFQVINNFAMTVGAGECVDLVVREYIEDVENNPTIYNGMPLRTEFRAFIDFDKKEVMGVVPYWHPVVMKNALKLNLSDDMERDYQTYLSHEDKLTREFNEHVAHVRRECEKLAHTINVTGKWSLDVMKNGNDFYAIDMATMESSALTELL